MNSLLSYYGLVDVRISTLKNRPAEKELPVTRQLKQNWRKVDPSRHTKNYINFLKIFTDQSHRKKIFLPLRLFANLMIESYGCSTCKSNLMVCKSTRSKILRDIYVPNYWVDLSFNSRMILEFNLVLKLQTSERS